MLKQTSIYVPVDVKIELPDVRNGSFIVKTEFYTEVSLRTSWFALFLNENKVCFS